MKSSVSQKDRDETLRASPQAAAPEESDSRLAGLANAGARGATAPNRRDGQAGRSWSIDGVAAADS